MQIVVIDTNILVSALINPDGPPGQIVNMLLNQDFLSAVDDRILHEYQRILTGPKFRFDVRDVHELMHFVRVTAVLVTPSPLRPTLPDVKDQAFWEVTKEVKAKALITGNLKHFPSVKEAISPSKFLLTVNLERG